MTLIRNISTTLARQHSSPFGQDTSHPFKNSPLRLPSSSLTSTRSVLSSFGSWCIIHSRLQASTNLGQLVQKMYLETLLHNSDFRRLTLTTSSFLWQAIWSQWTESENSSGILIQTLELQSAQVGPPLDSAMAYEVDCSPIYLQHPLGLKH